MSAATTMRPIAEINADCDLIAEERAALRVEAQKLARERDAATLQRELDIWGLTADEYAACKAVQEAPRLANARHAGALSELKKAKRRAVHPKRNDREKWAAMIPALEQAVIAASEDAVAAASKPVPALAKLLNEARVKKGLAPRNVMGGSVG